MTSNRPRPPRALTCFAALSAIPCALLILVWLATFPDDDFTLYVSFRGRLYCLHTFDSGELSLTLREYSPWPAHVPLQCHVCAVEAGTEVPAVTSGLTARTGSVYTDAAGQPATRKLATGQTGPLSIRRLLCLPILPTAMLTGLPCLAWLISAIAAARRRGDRIAPVTPACPCLHCGYDCRATPHRCPECGRCSPTSL